jgi:hypothetical protein
VSKATSDSAGRLTIEGRVPASIGAAGSSGLADIVIVRAIVLFGPGIEELI